ncbi:hypothetical protein OAV88_00185 [bacterium]|jgi:hypothetical protein|nr:hypothetical protein [bacterium]
MYIYIFLAWRRRARNVVLKYIHFQKQGDKKKAPASVDEIIAKATNRAFKGGFAGSMAAALQVTSLMWVRTTMNYQYRYGTGTFEALRVRLMY